MFSIKNALALNHVTKKDVVFHIKFVYMTNIGMVGLIALILISIHRHRIRPNSENHEKITKNRLKSTLNRHIFILFMSIIPVRQRHLTHKLEVIEYT